MQLRDTKGRFTNRILKVPTYNDQKLLEQLKKHVDRMVEEKLTRDFRQYWLSFIKDLAYSYELNEELEWD